jgi:hypothetical protein
LTLKTAVAKLSVRLGASRPFDTAVTVSLLPLQELRAMPKFIIEREIPGAGSLNPDELQAISQKSCGVLGKMGPSIQWLQSYVTNDKVYCVYIAPDENAIREHADLGGFPANSIAQVQTTIDPTTAEKFTADDEAMAFSQRARVEFRRSNRRSSPVRARRRGCFARRRSLMPQPKDWRLMG